MVRNHEVRGSIPLFSTTSRRAFWFAVFLYLKIRLHFIGCRSFFDQSKLWSIIAPSALLAAAPPFSSKAAHRVPLWTIFTPAAQLGNAAPFREKSRLLRLCVCKRTHDAFTALSTFLGYALSFLLFRKRYARLACSLVNALTTAHFRYRLFARCACGANICIIRYCQETASSFVLAVSYLFYIQFSSALKT